MYIGLTKDKGWTLNDVDEMDIYYYLDLLIYDANKGLVEQSNALDDAGL